MNARNNAELAIVTALAAGALATLAGVRPARQCPPASAVADYVHGGGLCLAATTFGRTAGPRPALVVVVHGDISDGGAATYHVAVARALARPGVVAVALIRPGYWDVRGRKSQGMNYARRDSYTPAVIAAVAGAIDRLKKHYRARRVVYVGHSGGAAIGGVLIGRRPGLVDAAVLVSCPCDIARWRTMRRRAPWTRSLSPSDYAHRVPARTRVTAVTGEHDDNTAPRLARDYVARLVRHGVRARFEEVAGAAHGFGGLGAATQAAAETLIER